MKKREFRIIGCLWVTIVMFGLVPLSTSAQSSAALTPCTRLQGKTLRWIIPYPPGGGWDVMSRMVSPQLEKALGVVVQHDHIVGAGSLVAAKTLHSAPPDGRTIAPLNGTACLMAVLSGDADAVHPLKDLTPLVRLSSDEVLLLANPASPIQTAEDLIRIGRTRPIICGGTGFSGYSFTTMAMLHRIFGIAYRYIPNYKGSKAMAMAAIQNEVDIIGLAMSELALQYVESGELRPLLRLSGKPYLGVKWYNELPHVDGKDGLAATFAKAEGRDVGAAEMDAKALTAMTSPARIVFGPPGMEKDLAECLGEALLAGLDDPDFKARAEKTGRQFDAAGPADITAEFSFLEQKGKAYIDYLSREAEPLK